MSDPKATLFANNKQKKKVYTITFREDTAKVIVFAMELKRKKRYVFKTYDKYGKKTERIKVDIKTVRREPLFENVIDGKVQEQIEFCPTEKNLFFMEVRLLAPKKPYCTCAYVIMFIEDK
ncbi:hypothetical protein [Bernardetia sp.]|uniref:hypothetical protein n=1 Tax=Bernardetia sp. TaxID=1937974 RepID=UPI0025C27EA4|nr:hypothetical protein [Bernardetia sp.]